MKILICFLILISTPLNAKECFEKEKSISYFYVNGVGVSRNDGMVSIYFLSKKFNFNTKKNKISLLYNPTDYQGNCSICKEKIKSMLKDAKEVLFEKSNEYKNIVKKNNLNEFFNQSIDKSLVIQLNSKLSTNKPNLVFAHSQGNLIANQICHYTQSKMEIISIATPAGELPCNTLNAYALYKDDKIIGTLRDLTPSLKYIKPNFNSHPILNIDITNHLLTTYLNDPNVFSLIESKFYELKEKLYNEYYNFEFLKMEIGLKEKKEYTADSQNSLEARKEKANQKMREFFNYKSRLAQDVKEKGLVKDFFVAMELILVFADKPLPVKSDQELADFISAIALSQYEHCTKNNKQNCDNLLPKKIREQLTSRYEPPTISLFPFGWEKKEISCNKITSGVFDLSMGYSASKQYLQLNELKINKQQYLININKSETNKREIASIGSIIIKPNDDGILQIDANIKNNMEQMESTPNKEDVKDGLIKCNTLWKLQASSYCKKYGKYIEDTYL